MKLVLPLTVLFLLSNFGSCETYPIRYIVRGNGAKEAAAALGGKVVLEIPSRGVTAVEFDDEGKADDLRKSAEENGFFVEKDQIRKLIPNMPSDDEVISSNEEIPWGINAIYEREGIPDDFPSVEHRVCIVDSGYSSTHPDLPGDATGEPNDWNVDGCNHGTHVAGTISAIRNNNQGVVGVFPSAPAMLILKAFTGSNCQYTWASNIANAAQVCFQNGAKIVNMSLGGTVFSPFEEEVFSDLYNNDGVLSIAAAGNSGNTNFFYPASYDTVMSVAATDQSNEAPVWSQRNSQVEISAPGVGVKSTVAPDSYASYSGTSMATPHVAGAALVLWNKYPLANNIQIRQALIDGAKDLGEPERDDVYGHGFLDYWTSVDMLETLLMPSSPPPTPPPTPCMGNKFRIELTTDNYGSETSWNITDSNGAFYVGVTGYASNTQDIDEECLPIGCWVFTIFDSYGDGICCNYGIGSYKIFLDNIVIKEGGEFGLSETTNFCGTSMPITTAPVIAPTKLSVMPSDISSAEPSNVASTNPTSSANNPPPTPPTISCMNNLFVLNLTTDGYGHETSWNITDSNGGLVESGNGYSSDTTYIEERCLPAGLLTFTITDSGSDGICCNGGNGSYECSLGGVVIYQGAEFFVTESFVFIVDGMPSQEPSNGASTAPSVMPSALSSIVSSMTPTASDNTPSVASISPSTSNEPSTPGCSGSFLAIYLQTDNYGSQTRWILYDIEDPDEYIDSGFDYASNTYYESDNCLPVGCYQFKIFDSNGDGICCTSGNGYYKLTLLDYVTDLIVIKEGGQFGRSETTGFCVTDNSSPPTSLLSYIPTVEPSSIGGNSSPPTSLLSYVPTVVPSFTSGCDDSPLPIDAGGGNSLFDCSASFIPRTCVSVQSHCPSTCDNCAQFQCEDSTLPFKLPSSCAEVASLNSETFPTKDEVCGMDSVKKTCRETCLNPHPSCP